MFKNYPIPTKSSLLLACLGACLPLLISACGQEAAEVIVSPTGLSDTELKECLAGTWSGESLGELLYLDASNLTLASDGTGNYTEIYTTEDEGGGEVENFRTINLTWAVDDGVITIETTDRPDSNIRMSHGISCLENRMGWDIMTGGDITTLQGDWLTFSLKTHSQALAQNGFTKLYETYSQVTLQAGGTGSTALTQTYFVDESYAVIATPTSQTTEFAISSWSFNSETKKLNLTQNDTPTEYDVLIQDDSFALFSATRVQ